MTCRECSENQKRLTKQSAMLSTYQCKISILQIKLEKLLKCRSILRQALSNISAKSIIANTEDKMVDVAAKALSRSIDNSGF